MKITPRNNNGSILIRFKYQKQNYTLSCFGKYEDKVALLRAEQVAKQIELDIASNNFDSTLEKYGQVKIEKPVEALTQSQKTLPIPYDAVNAHYAYREKIGDCSNSHLDSMKVFLNKLQELKQERISDPIEVVNWLNVNLNSSQLSKNWSMLCLAYDWLENNDKIDKNPYRELKKLISWKKHREESGEEEWHINPFSEKERDLILEYFRTEPCAAHYYRLVYFLFFVGCRPGEAIALKWKDVQGSKITFTESKTDKDYRKRLKTQKSRTIGVSDKVLKVLGERGENEELVFPNSKGDFIRWDIFRMKSWTTCLKKLGIPYRKPYQCRHTFITLAIKQGVTATLIAKHCGNSTEMIEKHYLGDLSDKIIEL